jgi:uncharacterized glyoxalase superfamily protein PhnB
MPALPADTRATVTPCLQYHDAPAAIEWLCRAFGFEKHLVVPGEDGTILHAQLSFGNGMIMLGSSAKDNAYSRLMVLPNEIDGRQTQTTCLCVSDADLIYARAREAGAEILMDIVDADYGGRGFTCRDLEGHVWTIGTYDPWKQ